MNDSVFTYESWMRTAVLDETRKAHLEGRAWITKTFWIRKPTSSEEYKLCRVVENLVLDGLVSKDRGKLRLTSKSLALFVMKELESG